MPVLFPRHHDEVSGCVRLQVDGLLELQRVGIVDLDGGPSTVNEKLLACTGTREIEPRARRKFDLLGELACVYIEDPELASPVAGTVVSESHRVTDLTVRREAQAGHTDGRR